MPCLAADFFHDVNQLFLTRVVIEVRQAMGHTKVSEGVTLSIFVASEETWTLLHEIARRLVPDCIERKCIICVYGFGGCGLRLGSVGRCTRLLRRSPSDSVSILLF